MTDTKSIECYPKLLHSLSAFYEAKYNLDKTGHVRYSTSFINQYNVKFNTIIITNHTCSDSKNPSFVVIWLQSGDCICGTGHNCTRCYYTTGIIPEKTFTEAFTRAFIRMVNITKCKTCETPTTLDTTSKINGYCEPCAMKRCIIKMNKDAFTKCDICCNRMFDHEFKVLPCECKDKHICKRCWVKGGYKCPFCRKIQDDFDVPESGDDEYE